MSKDKSQGLVTWSSVGWGNGAGHGGVGAGAYLSHVFSDNVQPTLLLHDDTQELYQVAVPQLPGVDRAVRACQASLSTALAKAITAHLRHDRGFS